MKRIELSKPRGIYFTVSDEDYVRVAQHKWYKPRRARDGIKGKVYGETISVARYIMRELDQRLKDPTSNLEVDHIDRRWINNERENLRVATQSQNAQNRSKQANTSSQYRGVCWFARNKRWMASIRVNGVKRHLGYFFDEINAAKAYDKAAREYFKEFAVCNFPEEA